MTAKLKPYPEYKASGIDWLGEIPCHWEAISLKHLSDIIMGQSPDGKEISDTGNIFFMQGNAEFGEKYPHPSLYCDTCAKYSRIGDILMSVRAPVGQLNISDNIYGIGRGLCSIKSTKVKREFLWYYLLISKAIFNYFSNGSTFEAITVDNLKNIPVAFPALEEQEAIAGYLDKVTVKIDALIREKTVQVEELRAYRSSLITETVTRGLNPDAPLSYSGIDWLGSIPEHWEVSKLKYLTDKIGSGITPKGGAEVYSESGILFIRSQNVFPDGLHLDGPTYIPESIDEGMSNTRVYKGDVLLNITGASIGRCCVYTLEAKANVNQHVCIIRPLTNKIRDKYLQFVINSKTGQTQIKLSQAGGNREGLNFEKLKNFTISVPPLSEQEEIADFLDEKTAKIDRLVEELTKQLDELAEYKQAVITEAVTGKVDVRDYKPKT